MRLSGLTVIEILVVVAVIGALLACMLPALHGARRAGMRLGCAANLRSIAQALIAYAHDSAGAFVPQGLGANPEFEFGGWQGNAMYARQRPLNSYLGLNPELKTESEAKVFRCPADAGFAGYPSSLYRRFGNSYRANVALMPACGFPTSWGTPEPWQTINSAINSRLPDLAPAQVFQPQQTLLIGDHPWLTQLEPLWIFTCGRSWHDTPHTYNLAFVDGHVDHTPICKGLYLTEQYRVQPFRDLDNTIAELQEEVPCACTQPQGKATF